MNITDEQRNKLNKTRDFANSIALSAVQLQDAIDKILAGDKPVPDEVDDLLASARRVDDEVPYIENFYEEG